MGKEGIEFEYRSRARKQEPPEHARQKVVNKNGRLRADEQNLVQVISDVNADGPEVGGAVGAGEVVVRDPAVAIDTPASGRGVADEEFVRLIVVPNRQQCMATKVGSGEFGYTDQPAGSGDRGLETLVVGDTEDEGDAGQIGA